MKREHAVALSIGRVSRSIRVGRTRPNIRVRNRTRSKTNWIRARLRQKNNCNSLPLRPFISRIRSSERTRDRCVNGLSYLSIGARCPPLRIIRGRPWARRFDRSRKSDVWGERTSAGNAFAISNWSWPRAFRRIEFAVSYRTQ